MRKIVNLFIKRATILACTSAMVLGAFVGVPQLHVIAEAKSSYDLSNPSKDEFGNTIYDCVYFGNYWQEDTNKDGKADKQDQKTPIKWRVLSVNGDDAFLVADQILDVQVYSNRYYCVVEPWKRSTIQHWLNGYSSNSEYDQANDFSENGSNFISNAFSETENAAIKLTHINEESEGEIFVSEDKLFLLSEDDLKNPAYGFSDPSIYGRSTDGAKLHLNSAFCGGGKEGNYSDLDTATGQAVTFDFDRETDAYNRGIFTGIWWLRSPNDAWKASCVMWDASIMIGKAKYGIKTIGVCPALHLDLSKTNVWKKAPTMTCNLDNFGQTPQKLVYEDTLAKPLEKVKATAKKKALVITWKPITDGISGYEIQYGTKSNFKGAKKANVAYNKKSYTLSKLKSKKTYYVRIRPYEKYRNGNSALKTRYGKWVKVSKKTK